MHLIGSVRRTPSHVPQIGCVIRRLCAKTQKLKLEVMHFTAKTNIVEMGIRYVIFYGIQVWAKKRALGCVK